MANVRLTPQNVLEVGLTATYTGALLTTNTYQIVNDGRVILHFKKSGAGSCAVTIVTPGTVGGHAIADQTVTVPATTGDVFCGPFPPSVYNSAGDISFTASEVTGLTVAVLRI